MPTKRVARSGMVAAVAMAALLAAAHAQSPMPTGRDTLKQRLGHKWSDTQRVNDCKVPPERRGDSRRPSECAPGRTMVSAPRAP